MQAGPSCPLLLGTLDSPDYWTDEALVATAQPATQSQWRNWASWDLNMQTQRNPSQPLDTGFPRVGNC